MTNVSTDSLTLTFFSSAKNVVLERKIQSQVDKWKEGMRIL